MEQNQGGPPLWHHPSGFEQEDFQVPPRSQKNVVMPSLSQCFGGKLQLQHKPEKIVSLVPSITENLILFGKTPTARTSFCIEPKEVVNTIPVIGGTKTPRVSKIISMRPDLVIANQEENIKEHVEEIQAAGIPVWVNFPNRVLDLVPLMTELASLCHDDSKSKPWIEQTKNLLSRQPIPKRTLNVITLIWKDPWMAVGKDTYTSDLLKFCGMENPVEGRYPQLTREQILAHKPDILFLPTEPYAFDEADLREWEGYTKPMLFCGEDLLWSGTRWISAVSQLTEISKSFW